MDPKTEATYKQIRDARDMVTKHAAKVTDPKCTALCDILAGALNGLEITWQ